MSGQLVAPHELLILFFFRSAYQGMSGVGWRLKGGASRKKTIYKELKKVIQSIFRSLFSKRKIINSSRKVTIRDNHVFFFFTHLVNHSFISDWSKASANDLLL